MLYASLVGPLLGVYYPLPTGDEPTARLMLSTSKLEKLWCSVYTETEVDSLIEQYGGLKLERGYARRLDYDYDALCDANLWENVLC